MPCNYPITGWQHRDGGPLTFKRPHNPRYQDLKIPCGQCTGCRLEHSRQWAMRCYLESQLHRQNCFITLTYNDQHIPEYGSLHRQDLTKFFKRLRKQCGPFRYYACGEYGDNTNRAHYHACLFGIDFNDKIHFRTIGEHHLYLSEQLTKIWGLGNTSIGNLTFETAAYTARYVMKKMVGRGMQRYVRLDTETGELIPLEQPYAVMSLRSAIGKQWLHQYHSDIYNNDKDFLVLRGKKLKPPKYFDQLYETINPDHMKKIKNIRVENCEPMTENNLRARELNARARIINRKQI